MTERLGIVYTPVEVVDFILHSVDHLLQKEFGQTLGSKDVHILDPFTGTGTFITRLLQSGLIKPDELAHKYKHEIHANELVLLAYYIAAINIEATYHGLVGGDYIPFEGICLTDTFQMYEKEDLVDALLVDNSKRRRRQKTLQLRVIVGNPPYSEGQGEAIDNNKNISYPSLDEKIRSTYGARSSARTRTSIYDSYIRAIRWASDRIGDAGVIGFVTNAGWLESNTADGLRKCVADEFSSLYVFHLRGNQRTSGETSRKEGGKIFGSGSRSPIAISLLVKNPQAKEHGRIFFHDVGDYLSREDKLEKIEAYASVGGISEHAWQRITPDEHGDWLKQRDDSFGRFIVIGNKRASGDLLVFENYSDGSISNRDEWVYNFSRDRLSKNVRTMINFYSVELERFDQSAPGVEPVEFVMKDDSRIRWDDKLLNHIKRGRKLSFDGTAITKSEYRPFSRQWTYFDRSCIWSAYQLPSIFPIGGGDNLAITTAGVGGKSDFSCFMVDRVFDRGMNSAGKSYPMYLYDEASQQSDDSLFVGKPSDGPRRRDAITDAGLAHFQSAYPGEAISKEDLFYYVYGILHSPVYRERYADNLSKELPRIPRVRTAKDFWHFSQAGRDLAALHLHYETVDMYPLAIDANGPLTDADYRVEKMKFAKKKDPETGKSINDRSTVIYNSKITMRDIPDTAWGYIVNGKAALDWVMERQAVRVDRASGIVNDANDWAVETMGNPRYPLELFRRVVTVSLETQKIVAALPVLDIRDDG